MDMETLAARLRLRHLSCFVSIAREQHLGRAAERLRLTAPAVSKTLAELEELTGTRLFERGRQGARLTPEGTAFLPHAVAVLDALTAASSALLHETRPADETVRVGALPTVAPDLLPGVLNQLRARRPATRVVVQTAANAPLLEMLRGGAIDFAIGRMSDPQQMMGLSFEFLFVEPLVLAVRPGHPLAGNPQARLADVLAYPLVVFARGTIPRHNTEGYLASQGLRLPHNCVETLSVSVGRLLTQRSDSVWFTPAGAVREDMAQGLLAQVDLTMRGTEEPVGLLLRAVPGDAGQLSEAAREFVSALRAAAAVRREAGEAGTRGTGRAI